MKYICFILSVCFFLLACSREKVFESPDYLYSNVRNLKIEKVVFSDTATVLFCSYEGKAGWRMPLDQTTVLSDENGVEYPLKRVDSDAMEDGMTLLSNGGQESFRLIFAPIPGNTKVFDLMAGANRNLLCLYGIHDAKVSLDIPVAGEGEGTQGIMDDFLSERRASVIHGKIEGYSRNDGYEVACCRYRTFENPLDFERDSVKIREDGSFSMELLLDYPLWADISTGDRHPLIPFYICPGDTLGITIKGFDAGKMTVEYATTRLEGCCATLLQHDVPVIYSGWESDGLDALTMTDSAFHNLTKVCLDENERLCNYMAGKYGFSPLEVGLAKSKCRFGVVFNHLVLANRIYYNRMGDTLEMPDGRDYALYGVLNDLPLEDAKLMCLPYFVDLLSVVNHMRPVVLAERIAFGEDGGCLQCLHRADSLQMEVFKGITKSSELPWTLQCFFLNKIYGTPCPASSDERDGVVKEISSCLTYPYLRDKLVRLDAERK